MSMICHEKMHLGQIAREKWAAVRELSDINDLCERGGLPKRPRYPCLPLPLVRPKRVRCNAAPGVLPHASMPY